jgi:hypothetical protein
MKKEEILRWLASHWHELESESDRSHCIPALDDEADIRQVNAEVLSCLGYQTSRPSPEDQFRHHLRREKAAVAGHQGYGKRSARSSRVARSEPGLPQDSIAKQPSAFKKK